MNTKALESAADLRSLPSVDALLKQPLLVSAMSELGHDLVVGAARQVLEGERLALVQGEASSPDSSELAERVAAMAYGKILAGPRQVINATGVIVHTNLARAPLCEAAIKAIDGVVRGYSAIELDLETGRRGDRHAHLRPLLCELLDVEEAIVVNNNASAVLLALSALARGKEVILSRGEAVEIGGGFRVPDIMRRSGAKLVEVGTTNRTYVSDYADAIGERTAALLAVHSSNFRVVGFVHPVPIDELAGLARDRGVPLIHDLGSGCLLDTTQFGLAPEPTVQASVRAGADLVCFSGDKLLGGPQAGIVAGRRELVQRLARDPLARATRIDKLTMAALHGTLVEYARGCAVQSIPVWQMIAVSLAALTDRAQRWAAAIPGAEVIPGRSTVGGGSLPGETLPTALVRMPARQPAA